MTEDEPPHSIRYRIDDAFNVLFAIDPRSLPRNTYTGGRIRRIGHYLYGVPECCW